MRGNWFLTHLFLDGDFLDAEEKLETGNDESGKASTAEHIEDTTNLSDGQMVSFVLLFGTFYGISEVSGH